MGDDLDWQTLVYAHAERVGVPLDPPNGISFTEHLLHVRHTLVQRAVKRDGVLRPGDHVRFYGIGGLEFRAVVTKADPDAKIAEPAWTILWHESVDPEALPFYVGQTSHRVRCFEVEKLRPLELLAEEG